MHTLIESIDGMTANTATVDNVNTSVQKVKTLVQAATTAIQSAKGSGSGNPLMLMTTTVNVCFYCLTALVSSLTNMFGRPS